MKKISSGFFVTQMSLHFCPQQVKFERLFQRAFIGVLTGENAPVATLGGPSITQAKPK
jgi:hypothetical protein